MAKDAYYFKHDAHARHDPKIKALMGAYGIEGYGRFWVIIEMLRESTEYKLDDKPYIWEALSKDMECSTEEVKKFITDCVEKFGLFVKEDGFIYSQSFLGRMSKLDEIRQKRKFAALERWTKTNDDNL